MLKRNEGFFFFFLRCNDKSSLLRSKLIKKKKKIKKNNSCSFISKQIKEVESKNSKSFRMHSDDTKI